MLRLPQGYYLPCGWDNQRDQRYGYLFNNNIENFNNKILELDGLVMPLDWIQAEIRLFLRTATWVAPVRAFCARLPALRLDEEDRKSAELFKLFANMKELRELWLGGDDAAARKLPPPDEATATAITAKLASVCLKLSYVRIINRAWWITRPRTEDGARMPPPLLRQLSDWEVHKNLPEAFDFRVPSVV